MAPKAAIPSSNEILAGRHAGLRVERFLVKEVWRRACREPTCCAGRGVSGSFSLRYTGALRSALVQAALYRIRNAANWGGIVFVVE